MSAVGRRTTGKLDANRVNNEPISQPGPPYMPFRERPDNRSFTRRRRDSLSSGPSLFSATTILLLLLSLYDFLSYRRTAENIYPARRDLVIGGTLLLLHYIRSILLSSQVEKTVAFRYMPIVNLILYWSSGNVRWM